MFVNISSDFVEIIHKDEKILIHRNDVDKDLGPTLVKLNQKQKITTIYTVNGPGGFTNLRIGTLCINLLNTLVNGRIKVFEITKFEILKQAFFKNIIPNRCIVYIGQKQNLRYYNLELDKYEVIKKSDIDNLDLENLSFDLVFDKEYYQTNYYQKMLKLNYVGDGILEVKLGENKGKLDLKILSQKVEGIIVPNYFVKPIISESKKNIKK